jgi:hypothetical protein
MIFNNINKNITATFSNGKSKMKMGIAELFPRVGSSPTPEKGNSVG